MGNGEDRGVGGGGFLRGWGGGLRGEEAGRESGS